MVTAIVESAVLPRSITMSFTPSSPVVGSSSSSISALPGTGRVGSLPHFNGLKIQFGPSRRGLVVGKSRSGGVARSGRVVSETQEAVVVVPEVADPTWKSLVAVPEVADPTWKSLVVVPEVADPTWKSLVCQVVVPEVADPTWKSLVMESDLPVLVEFWAPWCGNCRMIHPVIDDLAKDFSGKLQCYKLNTDESPTILSQYGIRSIPTIMLFKNGEKKDRVIGAVPKSILTTCIEEFL